MSESAEECQQIFEELKIAFVTAPVLAYADFSTPSILEVDASHSALGAFPDCSRSISGSRCHSSGHISGPERPVTNLVTEQRAAQSTAGQYSNVHHLLRSVGEIDHAAKNSPGLVSNICNIGCEFPNVGATMHFGGSRR